MATSLPTLISENKAGYFLRNGNFAFLLVLGLATYFWWPALWDGKLLIHGDAAHHGLSLLSLHARVLTGVEDVLWSSRIYGGHPLFAEGQGGFANPLNILCAYLFEPTYGIGVFHWLSVLLGAAGVYQLCRALSIGPWSATFASMAVVFSSTWVYFQHNLTVSATLAWVPWLMVATEYWLKQPNLYRAALLAIPAALLVFAGYPQLTQGTVIYLAASLLAQPFHQESRHFLQRNWRKLLCTGAFAVVLAVGLSAVQFLPMMELVGQSHRSEGTKLIFGGLFQLDHYFKGLLYFGLGAPKPPLMVGTLGNIAVVFLACSLFFFRVPTRIIGHALGTALLFNLGMEFASPIFRLVYEYKLIPGLHYHRTMHLFFPVAVVGFAVLAAYALDNLTNIRSLRALFLRRRALLYIATITYFAAGILLCVFYFDPAFSPLNFMAPALIWSAILMLGWFGRIYWLAPVAVVAIFLDALFLRTHVFNFYGATVIAQPVSLQGVIDDPQLQEYRTHTASISAGMVFLQGNDPAVGSAYRRYVKGLSPFPGLQWHIPSINGVMALPMGRKVLVDQVLSEELAGEHGSQPYLRLMDILGIRYIALDGPMPARGLSLFSKDDEQGALIYKNDWAKPRFQIYNEATLVDTPQDALVGLQAAQYEHLFIERTKNREAPLNGTCITCIQQPSLTSHIQVIEAGSMEYRVKVKVDRDAWLFLADANYPGWEATVNGQAREVYSAQVLGKAVQLDAGKNDVVIRYVPRTFYWGAGITVMTCLLVLSLFLAPVFSYVRKLKQARQAL